MLDYLRSTRFKMRAAKIIFTVMQAVRLKPKRIIRRHGVKFEVDLAEGIDMSLFLFGGFQKHITDSDLYRIPDDAVIFDIGANFGSISLLLASKHEHARVYAFEPTDYAFAKLKRNIELNGNLQKRVVPVQTFVSSTTSELSELTAFSSWKIDSLDGPRHPVHLGLSKKATGKQITLDRFIQDNDILKLDLIKIDTDGHELDVLKGAMGSISRFKPVIVFEMTVYLLKEKGEKFSNFEDLLLPLGYRLWDTRSGQEVRGNNHEQIIPKGGGIDILAAPPEKKL